MNAPRLIGIFGIFGALTIPACARVSTTVAPAHGPAEAPATLVGLLGEYDSPAGMRLVLEDSGRLFFADTMRHRLPLVERGNDRYTVDAAAAQSLFGRAG